MHPATFLIDVWALQVDPELPEQFFCISTKSRASDKWKDHFFSWLVRRKTLVEFLSRYSTDQYNLYFCPHGFSQKKRLKKYATRTSLLWADLDNSDPSRCTPKPQIAWESSPNRYAGLWRLNKPFRPGEVEEVNKALSYANGADHGGWDLTQVLRIPGTRNHKYPKSPHGRLLWFTDNQYTLRDLPQGSQELDPAEVLRKWRRRLKKTTWALLTATHATVGKRSEVLWRLESELAEQGLNADEIYTLIKHSVWNKFRGRKNEDEQLRRELGKVSENVSRPKLAELAKQKRPPEEGDEDDLGLVCLKDVEPEEVQWLWYPYLPIGKVVLLEGDPGLGKSWLTMTLTSHLSNRKRFPESDKAVGGNVLILSAEDGLGDTVRPRLDQLGANVGKIFSVERPLTFNEEDMEDIEALIQKVKPVLIIIDPLVAYMGGSVDLHKANETREVMARMARLAEEHKLCVLAIRHLTKGGRDKSIYRGLGSIDITGAARSVIMVGRHPEDPDEGRVLCHVKCNLAPLGVPIGYSLRRGSNRPFRWEGPVTQYKVEEILSTEATAGKSNYQEAVEFLKEVVNGEPRLADDIRRDAEAKGIPAKLINRAKRDLKLRAIKMEGGQGWKLG